MHFFYMDESGCTGANLADPDQPVFVLGGVSVRDEGWNETQRQFEKLISDYFGGAFPAGFELHSTELLSANGEGPFADRPLDGRLQLAKDALGLIAARSHDIHLIGIRKDLLAADNCTTVLPYDNRVPYLCAFDYLITYINDQVKNHLGASARGMVIIDHKDQFVGDVETITRYRRFEVPAAHRVKWIVEFSYPVDSRKNPMIQLSDLVVLCTRRFLEIEHGYRDGWPAEVKTFYAECYAKIHDRVRRKGLVDRTGAGMAALNAHLAAIRCQPVGQWKARYGIA